MLHFYNNNNEVGLDEAGRGPLIGNVYAAVVRWSSNDLNTEEKLIPPDNLIKDSKKLSLKKRIKAYEWIINNVSDYGIGFATNEEIDNINILEATKLAMERAISQLKTKPSNLIIDGLGWENKFKDYNVTSIVKGDDKFYSIAAASILAKVSHDNHINLLCEENIDFDEKYNLKKNMGYPTKKHIEGIKLHGYTNYHRKSYKIK
jgi:ribonuclease HII